MGSRLGKGPAAHVAFAVDSPVFCAARRPGGGHNVSSTNRVEYDALGDSGVSSELPVDPPRHQPARTRRHRCGDASTGAMASLLYTAVPAPLRTGLPAGADVGGTPRATGLQGPGTDRFHHAQHAQRQQNAADREEEMKTCA